MNENKTLHAFHKLPAITRLMIAMFLAIITFLLIQGKSAPVQFMTVWIGFASINLLMYTITMFTAHPGEISHIAKNQDNGLTITFLVIVVASFISLLAIVLLLRILPNAGESGYYYHILLSIGSVACSWLLIHTIFTFRYAHLYYSCKSEEGAVSKKHRGGLVFSDDTTPDYLDFAYFSFVIGMTFQVSDVPISSNSIRRLVLLHSLLSFLFNTVILALNINIIAGLVQR